MKGSRKGKIIIERLGPHIGAEAFNIMFWRKQSANAKWTAMWEMVQDLYRMRGKDATKPRLQRDIQNVQQI